MGNFICLQFLQAYIIKNLRDSAQTNIMFKIFYLKDKLWSITKYRRHASIVLKISEWHSWQDHPECSYNSNNDLAYTIFYYRTEKLSEKSRHFHFQILYMNKLRKKETIWLPIPAMLAIIFRGKLRHSAVQKRNINCFRGKPSKEASGRHWQMISVWKEGYNWNRQNTEKRRPYSKVINNISKIRGRIDYNIKCFQKAG